MEEIWKDIEGWEGLYKVSNLGRIKSLHAHMENEKIMKLKIHRDGYYTIKLRSGKIIRWYQVHRLVAKAFIPNKQNKPCVNHIDENKKNNNVNNLEWVTYKENNIYGTRLERASKNNPLSIPVLHMDKNGKIVEEFNSISRARLKYHLSDNAIRRKLNDINNKEWIYKEVVAP